MAAFKAKRTKSSSLKISTSVYPSNKFMPFAVYLEREEILFLLIIMKDQEKDIQINDKSSV